MVGRKWIAVLRVTLSSTLAIQKDGLHMVPGFGLHRFCAIVSPDASSDYDNNGYL